MNPWYGVDLDGTLAEYHGWQGAEYIGKPIAPMIRRVKRWLRQGKEVRCFTARIHNDPYAAHHVRMWLDEHGLRHMGQTCIKDRGMVLLIDDRAVTAELNTGKLLGKIRHFKPCARAA